MAFTIDKSTLPRGPEGGQPQPFTIDKETLPGAEPEEGPGYISRFASNLVEDLGTAGVVTGELAQGLIDTAGEGVAAAANMLPEPEGDSFGERMANSVGDVGVLTMDAIEGGAKLAPTAAGEAVTAGKNAAGFVKDAATVALGPSNPMQPNDPSYEKAKGDVRDALAPMYDPQAAVDFQKDLGQTVLGSGAMQMAAGTQRGVSNSMAALARLVGNDAANDWLVKDTANTADFLAEVQKGGKVEEILGQRGARIFNNAMSSFGEMLPAMVAGQGVLYSQMATNIVEEELQQGNTLGEASKHAGAEIALTFLMGRLAGKMGALTPEEQLSPALRNAARKLAKDYGIGTGLKGVGMEGAEELAISLTRQTLDINSATKPNKTEYDWDEAFDSAMTGSAAGAAAKVPDAAATALTPRPRKAAAPAAEPVLDPNREEGTGDPNIDDAPPIDLDDLDLDALEATAEDGGIEENPVWEEVYDANYLHQDAEDIIYGVEHQEYSSEFEALYEKLADWSDDAGAELTMDDGPNGQEATITMGGETFKFNYEANDLNANGLKYVLLDVHKFLMENGAAGKVVDIKSKIDAEYKETNPDKVTKEDIELLQSLGVDVGGPKDDPMMIVDPSILTTVKKLGGSTGAFLVKNPLTGAQWVRKSGGAQGQSKAEVEADNIYAEMGFSVPESYLVEGSKYAKFLEGAVSLGEIMDKEMSETEIPSNKVLKAIKEVQKGFALDAILGNRDVLGLDLDNILVTPDGTVYRVDNGSVFDFRAQGATKEFGSTATELETMRDPNLNPKGAMIFGSISPKELTQQVVDIYHNRDNILANIEDTTTRKIVKNRILNAMTQYGDPNLRPSWDSNAKPTDAPAVPAAKAEASTPGQQFQKQVDAVPKSVMAEAIDAARAAHAAVKRALGLKVEGLPNDPAAAAWANDANVGTLGNFAGLNGPSSHFKKVVAQGIAAEMPKPMPALPPEFDNVAFVMEGAGNSKLRNLLYTHPAVPAWAKKDIGATADAMSNWAYNKKFQDPKSSFYKKLTAMEYAVIRLYCGSSYAVNSVRRKYNGVQDVAWAGFSNDLIKALKKMPEFKGNLLTRRVMEKSDFKLHDLITSSNMIIDRGFFSTAKDKNKIPWSQTGNTFDIQIVDPKGAYDISSINPIEAEVVFLPNIKLEVVHSGTEGIVNGKPYRVITAKTSEQPVPKNVLRFDSPDVKPDPEMGFLPKWMYKILRPEPGSKESENAIPGIAVEIPQDAMDDNPAAATSPTTSTAGMPEWMKGFFKEETAAASYMPPNNSQLNSQVQGETWRDRVGTWFQKYFGPFVPQPTKALRIIGEEKKAYVAAEVAKSEVLSNVLTQEVTKAWGNPGDLSPVKFNILKKALAGDAQAKAALPSNILAALNPMRAHIDSLSRYMLSEGLIDPDSELGITLIENEGVYVNRTFRKHTDKNHMYKVLQDKQIVSDAKAYLRSQYPQDTDLQIEWRLLALIDKDSAASKIPKGVSPDYINFAKAMEKRQDIPEPLLRLMGENIDPWVNYTNSITKLAKLIGHKEYVRDVKNVGLATGLFSVPTDGRPDHYTAINATQNPNLAELSGLYASPNTVRMLDAYNRVEFPAGAWRSMMKVSAWARTAKAVYSTGALCRDTLSNFMFLMNNGDLFHGGMGQSFTVVKEAILKNNTMNMDYIQSAIRHNILGSNTDLAYIRELAQQDPTAVQNDPFRGPLGLVGKVIKGGQSFDRNIKAVKSGLDGFVKLVAWENKKRQYAEAYPNASFDDVAKMAAEDVLKHYPNPQSHPQFVKTVGQNPLFGDFVGFTYDSVRCQVNTMKTALTQAADPNPAIREMGQGRLVGLISAGLLAPAMSIASKIFSGITDEEEEALNRLDPSWDKNSTFLYLGRDEKGHVRRINMSYIDPFSMTRKAMAFAIKDKDPVGAVDVFAEQYLRQGMVAEAVTSVVSNRTQEGYAVYNPEASVGQKAVDIASVLVKPVSPEFVNVANKLTKAAMGELGPGDKPYSLPIEVAATMGIRMATVDPETQFGYRSNYFGNAVEDSRTGAFKAVSARESVTPGRIIQDYRWFNDNHKELVNEAHLDLMAAIRLGADPSVLYNRLSKSTSGAFAGSAFANRPMPLLPGDTTLTKINQRPNGQERWNLLRKIVQEEAAALGE